MPRTPPLPATARPRRVRLIGLALGAMVGTATTAALLVAGLVSGIASGGSIALLFGPEGLFAPDRGARYVWAVPPIAAGLAGALVAPWATRGPRWAGTTMGFVTYAVGIAIGPLFVLVLPNVGAPPTAGSSAMSAFDTLLSLVFGVGVLWFIGAVILAPLLVACVLGGIAWAAGLRRSVAGPDTVANASSVDAPLVDGPSVAMVVVASVLGLLWLLLVTVLQVLADSRLD